jgi:4-amino-4-deoxy-L-arabinose transferase-like glycosyltransferase
LARKGATFKIKIPPLQKALRLKEVASLTEIKRGNWTKDKIFFLFIIPLFLYISLLPVIPLIEPDEARYSDIPSLMNRTGDYITPHLNHVVYLEKPPLCYWVTALLFKIFGENDFSSRLFAALCAWGCILLVYRIGTFFHDKKTGVYSAGVLSTFLYYSILGKINILDMPLTLFVCLATWAGYRYFAEDCQRKGWLYLLYVSSALAFLTKGLIGVLFPFAITVLWLSISKRWRDVLRLFSPVGMILFLLISCPWIILVQKANKDFLWFFFIREHFLRYTTTLHGRGHTILFYVPFVILGTLPWSAFLLKALKEGADKRTPLFKDAEKHFLLTWIFFIFIFFSISSSKLVPYIAPIFLPIAIIFGHLFRLYEDRNISLEKGLGRRLLYDLPIILQSLMFITALISPSFIKYLKPGKDWDNIHFEYGWRLIILPILFQMMIIFLPSLVKQRWGKGWFLTIHILSALFFVSILFPMAHFLTSHKSAYPVSKAIHAFLPPNKELYQFRISLYGIDFYNKIRTPIVDPAGELKFGFRQLPPDERSHYDLSYEEFYQRCKENGGIYCITRYRNLKELKIMSPTLKILWNNEEFYLLQLRG